MNEKKVYISEKGLFLFALIFGLAIVGSVLIVNWYKYTHPDIWLVHTFLTNSVGIGEMECMIGNTTIGLDTLIKSGKINSLHIDTDNGEIAVEDYHFGIKGIEIGDTHCKLKYKIGKGEIIDGGEKSE